MFTSLTRYPATSPVIIYRSLSINARQIPHIALINSTWTSCQSSCQMLTLIREGGYRILTSSRGEISFPAIDRADLGMLRRREARLEIRGGNRPLAIGDDQKLCQEQRARPTAPNRGWCTPTTVMYTPTCRCLGATNTKSA